jgi:hypothetical protein
VNAAPATVIQLIGRLGLASYAAARNASSPALGASRLI